MSRHALPLAIVLLLVLAPRVGAEEPATPQIAIPLVERMPRIPQPFCIIRWKDRANDFDRLAFDLAAQGKRLPLVRLVDKPLNIAGPGFTMPSYVGSNFSGEGVACLGAVVGSSLVGIDKSRQQGRNWVAMCQEWSGEKTGRGLLVLNGPAGGTGQSAWYELLPGTLFCQLTDRYPQVAGMDRIMRATADQWCDGCRYATDSQGKADFNWTAINLATKQPVFNGKWREPDMAAGMGWIEYMAWTRWHEPKHIEAARRCANFLERRRAEEPSPLYEVLLYYAPVLAARLNVEAAGHYDVAKLLNWCLSENRRPSQVRYGWGIIAQRFGDYDCHGLQGSTTDCGGYAFAMNTFHAAGMVAPLARYDARFARAEGKWLLNLANAARLFYPDALPDDHQSCPGWKCMPANAIAYEGLRKEGIRREGPARPPIKIVDLHRGPYASGDPTVFGWGPTDLGLYGTAHVGFLAALIERTNQEHILQLDLLATDFFHGPAYPTYLYYNPENDAREIQIEVGPVARDLYDAVAHRFLVRGARGKATLSLAADQAAVIVVVPAGGKVETRPGRLLVDGGIIRCPGGSDAG